MWGTILSIVAPLILGKMFSGDGNSSSGSGSTSTPSTGSPYDIPLQKMAYDRVAQAQPLYEAVLRMANARLPRMYQASGSVSPFNPGGPEQPQTPTSSRGTGNGPSPWPREPNYTGLPDYLQGIEKDPWRRGDRLEK